MTGWRLGYAAGNKVLIDAMKKIHQYGIMCSPTTAQYAAIEALKNGDDSVKEMASEYNRRRRVLVNGFREIGLECFEPLGALYVFPSIKSTGMTSAIIAQLVNVLYNIVDRIFIGRIPNGEIAMAGVGVAFPIIMIVSAFSALIGMGGAPIAAIKMGAKDNDEAEKIMSNSFSMLIIIGAILTVVQCLFR